MNFGESVKRNLTTSAYAQFSGRASRSEYWWFYLAAFIITFVIGFFEGFLTGGFGPITLIATLALFIPGLATTVRRLHDTGKSGWTLLLALIPLLGPIVLFVFYVTKGEDKTNKYGSVAS